MTPKRLEEIKAKAEEALSIKQCVGAMHGCPHCYFEVSPVEALELIEKIDRTRGEAVAAAQSSLAERRLKNEALAEVERLRTGPRIIHAKGCKGGPMSLCTCGAGFGDEP